jgi:hypothetical protein
MRSSSYEKEYACFNVWSARSSNEKDLSISKNNLYSSESKDYTCLKMKASQSEK